MAGHECYHCKEWVEEAEAHNCWSTTEAALTRDLAEHLRDAWERLRETADSFGEQRVYASYGEKSRTRLFVWFCDDGRSR